MKNSVWEVEIMNNRNIKIRKSNYRDIDAIANLIYFTEVNPGDV